MERMPLWLAKKIVKDIAADEQENESTTAEIIWHGGEPLLAGIDFYKSIFDYQKRFPISFKQSFQTNGELMTQEWCDLFKEYECTVGFSMDGPPKIHDQQRKNRNGLGTSSKVLNGMKLCTGKGIKFGVLCVVTDLSSKYPETISNYFYSKGIKNFDFLPSCKGGEEVMTSSSGSLSPYKFSIFMEKVFDWYLDKDDPDVDIRIISNVMSRLFGGRNTLCSMQGTACGRFLTIYPDGKVMFCDDYEYTMFEALGNIKMESISQIIKGDRFRYMRESVNRRLNKCQHCEVVTVCQGGCPRHWNEEGSYFCSYYKEFYYYCYDKISQILQNAGKNKIKM